MSLDRKEEYYIIISLFLQYYVYVIMTLSYPNTSLSLVNNDQLYARIQLLVTAVYSSSQEPRCRQNIEKVLELMNCRNNTNTEIMK